MEQDIYVDVLFVTNYIINMLLIMSVSKISSHSPKRRRIVAAALFGAATSLTIFLPFTGFFLSLIMKLAISAGIVLIAFQFNTLGDFLKRLLLFFAISFSFAGVMLGIWLMFAPKGMTYYNGIVYFDVSPLLLIITTIAAYILLSLAARFTKGKKLSGTIYETTIFIGDKHITLKGLIDTGNHLTEPFSSAPVVVCAAEELAELLPPKLLDSVIREKIFLPGAYDFGLRIRMIPFSNVGGSGILPAFKADYITIETPLEKLKIEQVYIGLSSKKIGNDRYSCLLNPDMIGFQQKKYIYGGAT